MIKRFVLNEIVLATQSKLKRSR